MAVTIRVRLRKAGGSLIATIPKDVVVAQGLRPGKEVVATLESRREAVDELWGVLRGIGPWDRSWTRGRGRN